MKVGALVCLTATILCGYAIAEDHGDKKEDNADDAGWVSLIPEHGFEGWSTKNLDKYWSRKDGMIVGENADKKNSDLFTDKEFGDYELIVEYKNDTEMAYYDSGVFLRGKSHQVQIGISGSLKVDLTGCIYCPKDGNGSYPQQPREKVTEAHKNGEWNTLHIITKGKQITTHLNGVEINDYTAVKYPDKGKIGLQLHARTHMNISFRTVKIKTLESE
ncbi:MAG: DUF1080 domain-containing protein [Planctomycetota bacterium]